ncbi:mannose-1-phosphate guanylyltransferase [Qipengyuania sp. MTN3-11]|uniref:mannose-1-phosphate guanylyltransferase n=1 Tax=Qipengyuania sp. MTN3-11 TaxID=3056557 RepID=UPI0036F4259B
MSGFDPKGRIVPVILCGGSGTRLWPRSRRDRPKPFLPLLGERTLFQQSLDRVSDRSVFAPPLIVAGEGHVRLIEEQASQVEGLRVLVEPTAKNTAPAIALAAASLPADAIMLVCPSDHYIEYRDAFVAGAKGAAALAREGYMVAFGIEPSNPETGYGYIRRGEALRGGHRIARFVEKPDRETAERLLQTRDYVWNGGIFAFRAGALLEELHRHRPEMADLIGESIQQAQESDAKIMPAAPPFTRIVGESIDYALMENTECAAVVSADMGWSDIGNWDALMAARPADPEGNRLAGPVDAVECRNVMVDSDGPRVSVVGIEDAIVVIDGDEVLVMSRAAAQSVGKLPGALAQ